MTTRLLGIFRDPLRTFLVLAIAVGGFCAFAIPWFGGIDEPAHFYRSYQISEGTLVPDEIPGSDFSGACLPTSLVKQVEPYQASYFQHLLTLFGGEDRFADFDEVPAADGDDRAADASRCASREETPLTFSTFGSPVPYAPQTASVLVGRALGMSAGPMLILGRIVMLAVYVAMVGVAITRAPRAKWAICAVALVPVALFQSVGWSHDAITTAVALLVVSSALRALDPPSSSTSVRGLVLEAVLLSVLLGFCKPVYVVMAGLYLLPLIGRGRRRELWPMVLAPVAGVVTSVVLNEVGGGQWRTDADYFGIRPDAAARRDELTSAPWHFAADAVRTVWHETGNWLEGLWGVGPSVTNWPWVVIAVGVAVYLLVALQRDRDEPRGLDGWQRGLVVLVLIGGLALVLAANYVYWTTPGNDVITGVQARYLEPLLVLIPVAIGGIDVRWLRARDATVPLAVLLVPCLAVFCVTLAFRMH